MYLLYCDETNIDWKENDFLIYGGLAIKGPRLLELSKKIDEIRDLANIESNFLLKFKPSPENLNHNEFSSLKQKSIKAAIDYDAKLFVYAILHNISSDPDRARLYGINVVCNHFNKWLDKLGSETGLVLIDRFNDKGNQINPHLREKFSLGIRFSELEQYKRLANIVGFHQSAIGQSHFRLLLISFWVHFDMP